MRKIVVVALIVAAAALIVWGGSASGDNTPGPNPRTMNKDFAAFGYFDTTFTAVAGGDSVFFGFPASFVQVTSLTASANITTNVIGSAATIRNVGGGTTNMRAGLPLVYSSQVTLTAASGEYVSRVYDTSCNAIFYGVRVAGTGSVLVEASRCAE